jgi:hypothetical protein
LQEVLTDDKIAMLLPIIENSNKDINDLKITVGSRASFFELRAVINHVQRLAEGGN